MSNNILKIPLIKATGDRTVPNVWNMQYEYRMKYMEFKTTKII